MTEFQIGLLVLGVLIVAGVVIYNKLQKRAAVRRADRSFRSTHDDALMEEVETRREPTLEAVAHAVARPAPLASESLPDPRLDYVIELDLPQPVEGAKLLEHWAGSEHRFAQRALLAGSPDGETWAPLKARDFSPCRRARAGLQLVTRQGPAGEGDLIEFRSSVETLAAKLGATASCPEMKQAIDAARELDRISADSDVQVVMHVVAGSGSSLRGTKIRLAAESAGLALESDGRFALRDSEGRLLYALSVRDGARFTAETIKNAEVQGLSLEMDMPRAPDTERTYDAMVRFARHLCALLGASLVDDNGNALDERSLAAIGAQLKSIRNTLDAKGFAPGSAAALRLFS
jgi:ZipA, C-terminal FtsZ-binding domain